MHRFAQFISQCFHSGAIISVPPLYPHSDGVPQVTAEGTHSHFCKFVNSSSLFYSPSLLSALELVDSIHLSYHSFPTCQHSCQIQATQGFIVTVQNSTGVTASAYRSNEK